MVYDTKLLFHKHFLNKEIKVGLVNGSYRTVNMIGSVMLTDTFAIDNVLLVNGFKHNLVFVSKLI